MFSLLSLSLSLLLLPMDSSGQSTEAQNIGSTSFEDATSSFNTAVTASIVCSILFLVGCGVLIFYFCYCFHKKIPDGSLSIPSIVTISQQPPGPPQPQYNYQHPSSSTKALHANMEKRFTKQQLAQCTDGWKTKLGQGGFGPVYYGKLENGREVAIKRLSATSQQGTKEFFNEVELLTRIHHKNLVSLVGFCDEDNENFLVYDYMPGGTLHDHLHGQAAVREPLDWISRLKIALDAAKGLEYLHTGCDPYIIHRDVKSSNILLDKINIGKVSDFGLSKASPDEPLSHLSTVARGTFGYMDPEYAINERLSTKSDVYSFGIVLLEVICGRKSIIEISTSCGVQNIAQWARSSLLKNDLEAIVDKRLGSNFKGESLQKVGEIILKCVEGHGIDRPTMSEVVLGLREALKIETKVTNRERFEMEDIERPMLQLFPPMYARSEITPHEQDSDSSFPSHFITK